MPRYPKSLASEAAIKVGALVKEGVKPVAAYATVAKDVGVPAATVGRWYKQSAAKRVRPRTPARSMHQLEEAARRTADVARQNEVRSDAHELTLADLAGEFESLNREIPALEEKLVTLTDRREELRKLIADGLGL